jgi:LacI family transcriptional regulator
MIHRSLHFIRAHAGENIGTPEIARAAGASRSTLDARFKRILGRTAHQELRHARVEMARELLLDTTLPLHEIARRCGFRSAPYLCYVFRRETGSPPATVRQHARGRA